MKKIFLSYVLSETTPGYGGSESFVVERVKSISCGDSCNQVKFSMSNHLGTHIDFPSHFDQHGQNVESYFAADFFFEKPFLLNVSADQNTMIDLGAFLESVPDDADFLIIKTGFCKKRSEEVYWKNNPGITPESAQALRILRPKIRAIGFDFISLTSFQNRALGRIAHRAFLGGDVSLKSEVAKPIWIVEDMDLNQLNSSPSSLLVAPLRCEKFDGAPVTVIAAIP